MPKVHINAALNNDSSLSGGATKQYYLDLILKEVLSCLNANAISYNTSEINSTDSAGLTFKMSSSEESNGNSGIKILFTSGNPESKRLSTIIYEHMSQIYYDPSKLAISSEEKEYKSDIPIVTIVFENSENEELLEWMKQNIEETAKQIVMSLAEYFSLPYVPCGESYEGVTKKDESIRSQPNLNAEIVGSLESGKKIKVLGQWENWYIVEDNGNLGYIQTEFVEV